MEVSKEDFIKDKLLYLAHPYDEVEMVYEIEEYLDELNNDMSLWDNQKVNEAVKAIRIEEAKAIPVIRCKQGTVNPEWLWSTITDYMDEKYGSETLDIEPDGRDLFDKFIKEFNEKQTVIVPVKEIGTIDYSKEVEEYFKEVE